jgi:hypothetical protein
MTFIYPKITFQSMQELYSRIESDISEIMNYFYSTFPWSQGNPRPPGDA